MMNDKLFCIFAGKKYEKENDYFQPSGRDDRQWTGTDKE